MLPKAAALTLLLLAMPSALLAQEAAAGSTAARRAAHARAGLTDKDPRTRHTSAMQLAAAAARPGAGISEATLGELYTCAEDGETRVRMACLEAAARVSPEAEQTQNLIRAALGRPSEQERLAALAAMQSLSPDSAAPLLIEALEVRSLQVRLQAVAALSRQAGSLSDDALDAIIRTAGDTEFVGAYMDDERGILRTNADLRAAAIDLLGTSGVPAKRASGTLTSALFDRSKIVRQSAAGALARLYDDTLMGKFLWLFAGRQETASGAAGDF